MHVSVCMYMRMCECEYVCEDHDFLKSACKESQIRQVKFWKGNHSPFHHVRRARVLITDISGTYLIL